MLALAPYVDVPVIVENVRIVVVPEIRYVIKTVQRVVEEIVHVPKIEYVEGIVERLTERPVTVRSSSGRSFRGT